MAGCDCFEVSNDRHTGTSILATLSCIAEGKTAGAARPGHRPQPPHLLHQPERAGEAQLLALSQPAEQLHQVPPRSAAGFIDTRVAPALEHACLSDSGPATSRLGCQASKSAAAQKCSWESMGCDGRDPAWACRIGWLVNQG